jgi:hypothetical protein
VLFACTLHQFLSSSSDSVDRLALCFSMHCLICARFAAAFAAAFGLLLGTSDEDGAVEPGYRSEGAAPGCVDDGVVAGSWAWAVPMTASTLKASPRANLRIATSLPGSASPRLQP